MQFKDAFLWVNTIRTVDWIGVVIVCAVAALTVHESYAHQKEITTALKSVNARTHSDHRGVIYSVAINDTRIVGNDVLSKVSRLGSLETISLSRSTLRDEQLFRLPDVRSLRSLALYNTNISNKSLNYVGACRTLEVLTLDGTRITNSGVRQLSSLKRLKYLSLARTAVDDRCVDSLASLVELREIDLRGANVTNVGVERLKKLLPLCQVNFDGLVHRRAHHASFRREIARLAPIRQPSAQRLN